MEGAERGALDRSLPIRYAQQEPSQVPEKALSALNTYRQRDLTKVPIRFKAVGNAPIMKENMYKITASSRFQAVIQFLRKQLGWKTGTPLFTYINLAFAPAPDDTVASLFKASPPSMVVEALD
ncbi:hypothetical protein PC9H_004947 [Pleurotus ostreatus]|uniref:Ubiquitin-like protein ATG12 n=2 Tax=Pleurotus ostreatus TaxID=5322 RepID=A0A8H6ZZK7_PLEOS|nr:uncharacterized protein PC9H_004947 [Pleurotus ostreatus]KAF7433003.1 hypothetical protein PC9H_004947 [Pleurotus ostreatus]KAJ8698397.1 Ubiquitin-like protein, variant 2 [Pleurotus ostreatus]